MDYIVDETWISATSTYNYLMKDPLLDWLEMYHKTSTRHGKRYSNPNNFNEFIMKQGCVFEKEIINCLVNKFPADVKIIDSEFRSRDIATFQATIEAMKSGIPIIYSGVLHNIKNKTFGIPDLLVRSDWIKHIIHNSPINKLSECIKAPKLGDHNWHYRVIDIKFTSLHLRSDGKHILNSGSFPAYKSQLYIYNQALNEVQGYASSECYILGRQWKYVKKNIQYNYNSCFDKLGVINYIGIDSEYKNLTSAALKWLREISLPEAKKWNITKYPLPRWELYPNMCNSRDYPWHDFKKDIATQNNELTDLWMIGPKNRDIAVAQGISSWKDVNCHAKTLGIKGQKIGKILNCIIDINKSNEDIILPQYINSDFGGWKKRRNIEFFVDFETCNNTIFDITDLPYILSSNIIFMIGVGHEDPVSKEWIFKDFTVNKLTYLEEKNICNEFIEYIIDLSFEYETISPNCIHWSHAESTMWADAMKRHSLKTNWTWLDLLVVFKEEPIVIHGCMSFGLKDVATTMYKHGLIQTCWDKESSCVDGQSAMVAAKNAEIESNIKNYSMKNTNIMRDIIRYNEVDVKVLYEIITYLRYNHIIGKRKREIDNNSTKEKNTSVIDSY